MNNLTVQRKLDEMIQSVRLYELDYDNLRLANILIRNCREDMIRWPGLTDDIIEDSRRAIEGLRVET